MSQETHPSVGSVYDVSRISRIPVSTLNHMRRSAPDDGPPHYYVGRRVYYPLSGPDSLESWIKRKLRGGAALAGEIQ